jgi:hypothetical protein
VLNVHNGNNIENASAHIVCTLSLEYGLFVSKVLQLIIQQLGHAILNARFVVLESIQRLKAKAFVYFVNNLHGLWLISHKFCL